MFTHLKTDIKLIVVVSFLFILFSGATNQLWGETGSAADYAKEQEDPIEAHNNNAPPTTSRQPTLTDTITIGRFLTGQNNNGQEISSLQDCDGDGKIGLSDMLHALVYSASNGTIGSCLDLSSKRWVRPTGDLYVTKNGSDNNNGQSYQTAFATIQKGLDVIQSGQTLVIGPGEYQEGVSRGSLRQWSFSNGLGSPDVDTVIMAEIPGTVVLRGDIPAPVFTKHPGYDYVYVADFADDRNIRAVNQLDTFEVLLEKHNIGILDLIPGGYVQDIAAGKLYISSTDFKPASDHRFSLSVIQDHGFELVDATRVIVDGLTTTGFNQDGSVFNWYDFTRYSIWGFLINHGRDCVIRNSRSYLNARGFGITGGSGKVDHGGNLIENSEAWANTGTWYNEDDAGGFTIIPPYADTIRNSTAYLNSGTGINIYGGTRIIPDGVTITPEDTTSLLAGNLSWGNEHADVKVKDDPHLHRTENSIALGSFSHNPKPFHCLGGSADNGAGQDTILLTNETDLDANREFADPINFDYRLQGASRFRGAMASGEDRGPHPFNGDVFFISKTGSDEKDGLSLTSAWKTLNHAVKQLKAGDTLYLEPGTYEENVQFTLIGSKQQPIAIKGRGLEPVILTGQWQLENSSYINLERLTFDKTLRIETGEAVKANNCFFLGADTGLLAINTSALRVTQSTFTGFTDAAVDLPCSVDGYIAGNLFNNVYGPAIHIESEEAILYSDYNSYSQSPQAWRVGSNIESFIDVNTQREPHAQNILPIFQQTIPPLLANSIDFVGGGTYGRPFGTFNNTAPKKELRLLKEATVHSVSATTANIQWMTSMPAVTQLSWGNTPDTVNSISYKAQPFATFSLTGLTPNTTYYLKLNELSLPSELGIDADSVTLNGATISFTTPLVDPSPRTYYVSTTGNDDNDGLSRQSAWQTIQYATDQVKVGDTVEIAGGHYHEQVYVKTTGTAERPITFTNKPGERVYLTGRKKALSNAFVIASKSYLVFDGLYFTEYGDSNRWKEHFTPLAGGDFNIYLSNDITITRCLSAQRDHQDRSIVARDSENLTFDNVVFMDVFNSMYLHHVSNVVMRHSVIARPTMSAVILYIKDNQQMAHFSNTIFTDMYESKADSNNVLIYSGTNAFVQEDCVYLLRDKHPPEWRYLTKSPTGDELTALQAPQTFVRPLFVDPQFAAVEELIEAGTTIDPFPANALNHPDVDHSFKSFFATNPEVINRGIGLQPEKFDIHGVPN